MDLALLTASITKKSLYCNMIKLATQNRFKSLLHQSECIEIMIHKVAMTRYNDDQEQVGLGLLHWPGAWYGDRPKTKGDRLKLMILIDGSYGEGGGQVIRTSLTLSALTGQPVRIEGIRARRPKPGLAPQHLAGVLAMARICNAEVEGGSIGSQALTFRPQCKAQPGQYTFDIAQATKGGSAGATTLLLQTVLLPLASVHGESHLRLRGGTHVSWSPSYDYIAGVYLPTLARLGICTSIQLNTWGFYPLGGGEIEVNVADNPQHPLPLSLTRRGDLLRVQGIAVAAELPAHIAQRIANRATNVLRANELPVHIVPQRVKSAGPGAGIFLIAEYENAVAGFSALGAKGKASDAVADEVCAELLSHHASDEPVDPHLADQILLPMTLARGLSEFRTSAISQHLLTNAYVIHHFLSAEIEISGAEGEAGHIRVTTDNVDSIF
jgi:RNA 3'-terminal phosphate cyclase (ATP)